MYDLCLQYDTDKALVTKPAKKQKQVDDDKQFELPTVSCISKSDDASKVGLSMCMFNECDAWTADPDLHKIFLSTPSDAEVAFLSAKVSGIAALKREVKHRKQIDKKRSL